MERSGLSRQSSLRQPGTSSSMSSTQVNRGPANGSVFSRVKNFLWGSAPEEPQTVARAPTVVSGRETAQDQFQRLAQAENTSRADMSMQDQQRYLRPSSSFVASESVASFNSAFPTTDDPNAELLRFFKTKGNDSLNYVEYQGVMSLITRANSMNESLVDLSSFGGATPNSTFAEPPAGPYSPRRSHYGDTSTRSVLGNLSTASSPRRSPSRRQSRYLSSGPKTLQQRSPRKAAPSSIPKSASIPRLDSIRNEIAGDLNSRKLSNTASALLEILDEPPTQQSSDSPESSQVNKLRPRRNRVRTSVDLGSRTREPVQLPAEIPSMPASNLSSKPFSLRSEPLPESQPSPVISKAPFKALPQDEIPTVSLASTSSLGTSTPSKRSGASLQPREVSTPLGGSNIGNYKPSKASGLRNSTGPSENGFAMPSPMKLNSQPSFAPVQEDIVPKIDTTSIPAPEIISVNRIISIDTEPDYDTPMDFDFGPAPPGLAPELSDMVRSEVDSLKSRFDF